VRCRADIDDAALRGNARAVGRLAGGGPELVMAVVKADAYGHGLEGVARALDGEVGAFAVACPDEAAVVARVTRAAGGAGRPVYLLSPSLPQEVAGIVAEGWIPAVSSAEEVRAFAAEASGQGRVQRVHVVVDTGMGRIGSLPVEAGELIGLVRGMGSLELDSVSSHFPSADEDAAFTRQQAAMFRAAVSDWQKEHGAFRVHLANSAGLGVCAHPAGEMVRSGLLLYGVAPIPEFDRLVLPVMRWSARVGLVRELPAGHGVSYGRTHVTSRPTRVATVTAGYGDGYPRHASGNGAQVLIGGRRCAVLGRVTMDQLMADVTELGAPVRSGDEVVLLGRSGDEEIAAAELAGWARTIPWHLFTGITPRTPRFHHGF